MIVIDGYIMAVIKDSESFYLFDSLARNWRGMADANGTAFVLEYLEVSRYPAQGTVFKKLDTRHSEILTNFLGIVRLIPQRT